jgi:hypothetical protein
MSAWRYLEKLDNRMTAPLIKLNHIVYEYVRVHNGKSSKMVKEKHTLPTPFHPGPLLLDESSEQ